MRFTYPIGEDAYITPLELRDASAIYMETERSRRHLREFLPWVDHVKAVDDTRRFITAESKHVFDGKKVHVTIWSEGQLAGLCSLFDISQGNRSATIGYWLGKNFQGRGLMTRSVQALVEHAFTELHLNRIEIRAHPENRRSRAIPERLGFIHEGTLAQAEWLYDKYVDSCVYGMTAENWKARKIAS